ncbi:hypothetical protein LTR08_008972 [Meristemomyces frigidus]|nr:hypothetical protein LTR08_008972 [Meristemomyces frigidus]
MQAATEDPKSEKMQIDPRAYLALGYTFDSNANHTVYDLYSSDKNTRLGATVWFGRYCNGGDVLVPRYDDYLEALNKGCSEGLAVRHAHEKGFLRALQSGRVEVEKATGMEFGEWEKEREVIEVKAKESDVKPKEGMEDIVASIEKASTEERVPATGCDSG